KKIAAMQAREIAGRKHHGQCPFSDLRVRLSTIPAGAGARRCPREVGTRSTASDEEAFRTPFADAARAAAWVCLRLGLGAMRACGRNCRRTRWNASLPWLGRPCRDGHRTERLLEA